MTRFRHAPARAIRLAVTASAAVAVATATASPGVAQQAGRSGAHPVHAAAGRGSPAGHPETFRLTITATGRSGRLAGATVKVVNPAVTGGGVRHVTTFHGVGSVRLTVTADVPVIPASGKRRLHSVNGWWR